MNFENTFSNPFLFTKYYNLYNQEWNIIFHNEAKIFSR